ncbi:putative WD repeat-containing protein [Cercospora beticola]|uniref:Putative WD repeat-containing protein n=1 Tax=Cercospora beticola TaxID=122368 RepID=A0A2G5I3B0_CERBT|nr:putative WD repeat-containing protein [Cercospora beticola]PIA99228.1 putative WD repeat-containing protein [Cercospora beticola]WPB00535.1 hypothetical protein RHO25_005155 [Cercospora beticola]CAK1361247.1 unnamed protein product [Cercospora beticola]
MSRSNDPGHYFQTTEAIATSERKAAKSKNKHGDPIKLSSKILAAIADPFNENAIYVAEAGGEVKRVDLESRQVTKIFDGSAAPLTCLTICPITKTLFTGSWDKTIYGIPLCKQTSERSAQKLSAHTDFLKCLLATSLEGKPILISGAADATIIIWDFTTSTPIHKLKGHTKALASFAIDSLSFPSESSSPGSNLTLFSSSSTREIRRWEISPSSAKEASSSLETPILAHETSIYALEFDSSGDLWTASADKTAKHLVRERNWEADTTLQHPDFVRCVLAFEDLGLVVTGCRDEEVRVWDAGSGKEICVYEGHFEEVTGLVALQGGKKVVSVSIDGTVRGWSLERKVMEEWMEERRKRVEGGEEDEDEGKGKKGGEGMLTAEEEAELAELMDSDED